MLRQEGTCSTEDDRLFDAVSKLPDVAGPGMAAQRREGVARDLGGTGAPERARDPLCEEASQWPDLRRPLPQRGDDQNRSAEAIVEISPEAAALDLGLDVSVGRASGISPTSSRNTVPSLAVSRSPGFALTAPVNAPRSCPNSSDSRSVSVRDAQFRVTKGFAARAEPR
jgi:hypothetical protein